MVFEDIKKELNLIKILIVLLIAAVGIYLLGILWQLLSSISDIIVIIILAWLLSFILEPLVEKIAKFTHLSKAWSTLITYVVFALIFSTGIFLLIPIILSQIDSLMMVLPKYLESAPKFVNSWFATLLPVFSNSLIVLPSVAQFFFSSFLILIVSFYLIADNDRITAEVYYLAPASWHERLKYIQKVIDKTFASFLRVQLLFGIFSAVATWIVLGIFGIQFNAFTSLFAGVLATIPLIGPFLSILPPLFIALLTNPIKALWIGIILLVIQQFIFNVVGPKLLGRAFKLHPLIILLSFLLGLKVAGGIGAIFAIPVFGIITIVLRELVPHFLKKEK
ncbi:MAG: AI-2E family transporter [bacterium]|nr:AI-2E family transporter [bacterium]